LTAIHRESGAPVLVDSSKSTWKTGRRLALLKECGFDVRGIHLVRDPRGVMYSISKGSNRLLESGGHAQLFGGMFRGLLGWVLANLLAEISLLKENTFVRIRYEDLVADPVAALGRIGTLLGVDMQPVTMRLATGDSLLRGHGVSGNRMRRQGPVTIVNDTRWRDALPLSGRMLALVAWPLARRYGYDVFQEVRSFSGKVYRSAK
jgi:hypothetical protein